MTTHRWLPLTYLVILGSSWGLHFSFIKIAAESGLSYPGIAAVTTAGVAVLMVLIALLRRRAPNLDRTHLQFYFVCALLGYALPFVLELYSAAHLPASVLTLVVSSTPLFTVVLAIVVRSDTVSLRRMFAIVIGTVSGALILLPAVFGMTNISGYWVMVAFSVPLTYAIYHNFVSKGWPRTSDSFQVACGEALAGLLLLVPVYLLHGVAGDLQLPIGPGHIAVAVMTGFAVIEIYLYFEILRIAGPVFASQTNFVTVVTGVLWAMIIFGERPSQWIWLSAALLGVALYFIATDTRSARRSQTPR